MEYVYLCFLVNLENVKQFWNLYRLCLYNHAWGAIFMYCHLLWKHKGVIRNGFKEMNFVPYNGNMLPQMDSFSATHRSSGSIYDSNMSLSQGERNPAFRLGPCSSLNSQQGPSLWSPMLLISLNPIQAGLPLSLHILGDGGSYTYPRVLLNIVRISYFALCHVVPMLVCWKSTSVLKNISFLLPLNQQTTCHVITVFIKT